MVNRSAVAGSAQAVLMMMFRTLPLLGCPVCSWHIRADPLQTTKYLFVVVGGGVFFLGGGGGGKSGDHLSGQSGNVCVLLSDC